MNYPENHNPQIDDPNEELDELFDEDGNYIGKEVDEEPLEE